MTTCARTSFVILSGLVILACITPARPAVAMEWSDAMVLNINAATDEDSDYYAHFAHDDSGNWVCVWCAAVPAATNRDFDILVSGSDDNGETWTEPALLDPFAVGPPEIEDDFHPSVYNDGAGHWVAVWYSHDNHDETIGDDTDILVSRSTDNGATWTSSVPLNSDADVDSNGDSTPSIATDGDGSWVAVWDKKVTAEGDYDIYVSRSTDHGATWTPLDLLHPSLAGDIGYDGSPSIATDEAGHWIVVWNSESIIGSNGLVDTNGTGDKDIFVSCSTNGLTWSAPATLNSNAATSNGLDDKMPRLVTDGAGRWVTVWYYGVWPEYDIKVSRTDDNGATWSPEEYLNGNALMDSGRDLYPVPATDGNGNWVVVWQSNEPFTPPVGTDYDIFFSYSTDNAVTWSFPGVLNSFAADLLDFEYDRDPEVLYAGTGKWRTVWGSKYNLDGGIGSDYDLMVSTGCLPLIDGDHDCDGDVDLDDYAVFLGCLTGPEGGVDPGCGLADLDGDSDVDLSDFGIFQCAFTSPS